MVDTFIEINYRDFEAEAWREIRAGLEGGKREFELHIDGGLALFHGAWTLTLRRSIVQSGYGARLVEKPGARGIETSLIVAGPTLCRPSTTRRPTPLEGRGAAARGPRGGLDRSPVSG